MMDEISGLEEDLKKAEMEFEASSGKVDRTPWPKSKITHLERGALGAALSFVMALRYISPKL